MVLVFSNPAKSKSLYSKGSAPQSHLPGATAFARHSTVGNPGTSSVLFGTSAVPLSTGSGGVTATGASSFPLYGCISNMPATHTAAVVTKHSKGKKKKTVKG